MIQFVYFDLDDTLLDHRHAENEALRDLHAETAELDPFSFEETRSAYRRVNHRVWREYAAGSRDKEGTRSGRFALLFEALGIEGDFVGAADLYMRAYSRHWKLVDNALKAFSDVAARYPTGVLTNGFAEAQRAKLARFPELTNSFASIVISEEEGVMKPHLPLFEIAANRAGYLPEEIAYVGDSLTSDIEGGLAAGWHVIWYNPGGDAPHHAEPTTDVPRFSEWTKLPSLLGL